MVSKSDVIISWIWNGILGRVPRFALRERIRSRVKSHPILRFLLEKISFHIDITGPDNIRAINALKSSSGVLDEPWHIAYAKPSNLSPNEIDLVAVVYQNAHYLEEFMISLVNGDFPADYINLRLVDNGSDAKSVRFLRSIERTFSEYFNSFEIIRNGNVGYGMGCDRGIRTCTSPLILISNIDVQFARDALSNILSVATADVSDVASWEFRQTPFEHPKYYDPVTLLTNWSSHAAILMRRVAYDQVGGYDSGLFMYGEDVELSYRLRSQGWLLRYVPKAVICHDVDFSNDGQRPLLTSGSLTAAVLICRRYNGEAIAQKMLKRIRRMAALEKPGARRVAMYRALRSIDQKWHCFAPIEPSEDIYFPVRDLDYELTRIGHDFPATVPALPINVLPKVSVVTRTICSCEFDLRACISSVLNQTYSNVEHIVVEDGSEKARGLVEYYARSYGKRIRYISIGKSGRSAAGNRGLSEAQGQYLMLLDDDDLLLADHVETLAHTLHLELGAVAAYSLAWEVESDKQADGTRLDLNFRTPDAHTEPYSANLLERANFIPIQSCLFRRHLFDCFGGMHEDMEMLEDWNMWYRYSLFGRFVLVPRTTSLYRLAAKSERRKEREALLHSYYEYGRCRNAEDLQAMQQSEL